MSIYPTTAVLSPFSGLGWGEGHGWLGGRAGCFLGGGTWSRGAACLLATYCQASLGLLVCSLFYPLLSGVLGRLYNLSARDPAGGGKGGSLPLCVYVFSQCVARTKVFWLGRLKAFLFALFVED